MNALSSGVYYTNTFYCIAVNVEPVPDFLQVRLIFPCLLPFMSQDNC